MREKKRKKKVKGKERSKKWRKMEENDEDRKPLRSSRELEKKDKLYFLA